MLATFDAQEFVASLGEGIESITLFWGERAPAARHRSLVAEQLARQLGAEVVHLLPPEN